MMKAWVDKCAYLSPKGRGWLEGISPSEVKCILVIRQCAFGDYMATRPFLVELRKLFPGAHVTLATISTYRYAIPEDLVDEIFIQDTQGSVVDQWRSLGELAPFDMLFDLADTARSRLLTFLTTASLKLGFPYRPLFNHLLYDVGLRRTNYHYEAEVLLDFLKVMGHKPTYPLDFAMPWHRGSEAGRVIAYFPFASTPDKSLSLDSWRELIEEAARTLSGYQHILLEGNKAEETGDFLTEIVAQHNNVSVQPCMELGVLAEWMACVSILVCGDTGVRNLALATHTPTLGVFFKTLPYRYWPRYENFHEAVFRLDGSMPDRGDILSSLKILLLQQYPDRDHF